MMASMDSTLASSITHVICSFLMPKPTGTSLAAAAQRRGTPQHRPVFQAAGSMHADIASLTAYHFTAWRRPWLQARVGQAIMLLP